MPRYYSIYIFASIHRACACKLTFSSRSSCCWTAAAAVLLIWSNREQQMAPTAEWSVLLEGLPPSSLSLSNHYSESGKILSSSWIANISFTSSGDVFYYFTVSLIHFLFFSFFYYFHQSYFHHFICFCSHFFTELRPSGRRIDRHVDDHAAKLCPRDWYYYEFIRLKMWVGVGLELIFNFFWIRRRNGSEASWPARISGLSRRQRADLHVGQFKGDGRDLARRRWITRGANRNAR